MAKPSTTFSISAPGFYGLNLSDSPIDLSQNFALDATNCVIDKFGRVASRKGWEKAHTANTDLGTDNIECIGELIESDGTATTLAAGGGFLFKLSGTTLTTLTYGGGGSAPTIAVNNWKFCTLNGVAMFWQRGYDPLIYDPAVSTSTFRRLNEKTGTAGTVPQCNEAIVAYGRVWCADTVASKQVLYFSDLLSPHIWTGGSSGTLDLRNVWPNGSDQIVALASHNDFLFIFGHKQILVYKDAVTPSTMSKQDSIVGIGCIARDSVQPIGEDVWFLSDTGVRSIMRTIQEKSAPFSQISKNVHDDIQELIDTAVAADIKSCFSAINSFYLITFPAAGKVYCFDTRSRLQDGSAKTTTWQGILPRSFCETRDRKMYIGVAGYIGDHEGYLDDTEVYRMQYYTTWIDFGNPIQTSILKKILLTLIGGTNQAIVFKWAYDFVGTFFSETKTISGLGNVAEYGIAEYNSGAEYSSNLTVTTLSANGSSSGKALQFGFECQVSSVPVSIQKIELFTKDGRV